MHAHARCTNSLILPPSPPLSHTHTHILLQLSCLFIGRLLNAFNLCRDARVFVCERAALSSFLEVCFHGLVGNVQRHVSIGSLHCQSK